LRRRFFELTQLRSRSLDVISLAELQLSKFQRVRVRRTIDPERGLAIGLRTDSAGAKRRRERGRHI
jgi:hypothetical protein